jgi:hypothetical protein
MPHDNCVNRHRLKASRQNSRPRRFPSLFINDLKLTTPAPSLSPHNPPPLSNSQAVPLPCGVAHSQRLAPVSKPNPPRSTDTETIRAPEPRAPAQTELRRRFTYNVIEPRALLVVTGGETRSVLSGKKIPNKIAEKFVNRFKAARPFPGD